MAPLNDVKTSSLRGSKHLGAGARFLTPPFPKGLCTPGFCTLSYTTLFLGGSCVYSQLHVYRDDRLIPVHICASENAHSRLCFQGEREVGKLATNLLPGSLFRV